MLSTKINDNSPKRFFLEAEGGENGKKQGIFLQGYNSQNICVIIYSFIVLESFLKIKWRLLRVKNAYRQ